MQKKREYQALKLAKSSPKNHSDICPVFTQNHSDICPVFTQNHSKKYRVLISIGRDDCFI